MLGLHAYNLHRIGYGFGMMGRIGGMIIMMILFIALVVVGIIWLTKNMNHKNSEHTLPHPTDRSIEILNERYAKGEISDEEYAKMKMELKKTGI